MEVAGRPILESVAAAAARTARLAPRIVVVGPRRDLITPVLWTREEPPGAGPVAGLQAGLAALDAAGGDAGSGGPRPDRVLILGGDMPFVGLGLDELLRDDADASTDVVIAQDAAGRDQYLFAVWRTASLRAALASAAANASLRSLYRDFEVTRRTLPAAATLDCDTPAQLALARELGLIQPVPD